MLSYPHLVWPCVSCRYVFKSYPTMATNLVLGDHFNLSYIQCKVGMEPKWQLILTSPFYLVSTVQTKQNGHCFYTVCFQAVHSAERKLNQCQTRRHKQLPAPFKSNWVNFFPCSNEAQSCHMPQFLMLQGCCYFIMAGYSNVSTTAFRTHSIANSSF